MKKDSTPEEFLAAAQKEKKASRLRELAMIADRKGVAEGKKRSQWFSVSKILEELASQVSETEQAKYKQDQGAKEKKELEENQALLPKAITRKGGGRCSSGGSTR